MRAKKLDERQLFKFLKSLEENKTKRMLQIDKEVAEVEKTLTKLLADQSEASLAKRSQTKASFAHSESLKTEKKRKRKAKTIRSLDVLEPNYEQFNTTNVSTKRIDKLLDSYYRFDEFGNRLQVTPLLSSANSSERASNDPDARIAWDISDFSPSELRLYSASASDGGSENASQSGPQTRASSSSPIKSGKLRKEKELRALHVRTGSKEHAQMTSQSNVENWPVDGDLGGIGKTLESNGRLLVSPQRNVVRKSGVIKVPALFVEELASTPVSKGTESSERILLTDESDEEILIEEYQKQSASQLPQRFDFDFSISPTSMAEVDPTLPVKSSCAQCRIPDCIFHDRTLRSNPPEEYDLLNDYYRTSVNSRSKQTGTPVVLPIFQSPSDLRKDALSARRTALSAPSPTPSEIVRDITYTPKNSYDEMNNADLDVVRSVRRPMKGSNREQMLRDKEANVRYTFDLMRQKMSAKVPPDFNTNYGAPTPKWKILNPLKLRHKINHSSPLHRMWKL